MKAITTQGVAVEWQGRYWCEAHHGGHGEGMFSGWGPIERARISDPRYCRRPIDMTYRGSPDEAELSKGRMVRVTKTVTYVVDSMV